MHGPTVLVEGKLLSGDTLLEYAQQKGLCKKCVQHVTHKRERKRLGMLRYTAEWVPLTVTDDLEGNFTVYKGYCLQPTCWTLQEVQEMLGERPLIRSASKGSISRKATPTRSRDRSKSRGRESNTGEKSPRRLQNLNGDGVTGERSPGSRSPRLVADLVENLNHRRAAATSAHERNNTK